MALELASPERITRTRVGRLRDRIVRAPQEICIERALYMTRAMAENWDRHPLDRMSRAFEHVLNHISVIIRDDEYIVGCRTGKLKGAPLFPENKIEWLKGDVDRFDAREIQRALIRPSEKQTFIKEIIPFWEGKTVEQAFESMLPADVLEDMGKLIFGIMLQITYGIGHFTMNHEKVLEKGLRGIIRIAEEKYHHLDPDAQNRDKGIFYKSVIRSLEAAISFANRYADLAEEMAKSEAGGSRKKELETIARICKRVPEHPAESFHEAVQSVYFIHLAAQIESGGNSVSLGRIDQILFPYYKKDLERGAITPDAARELLSLLFLKTNEIWNVLEEAYIPGGEGTEGKTTQNVTVGGIGADGENAENELSFIGLDAFADVRTVQPNFGVRIGSRAGDDFFLKAAEYAKDGVPLHFFNDDAIVSSLVDAGHTVEDARDYGVVGCLEPNAQGKTFGSTYAVQLNGLKCIELVLGNGKDLMSDMPSGPATGDPAGFTGFNDIWNAYDTQIKHFLGQIVKGMACLDKAIAEQVPSPFASAMVDGPMEAALDLTSGGAVYNSTGVQLMGFSNIVDSLYAVKTAVFEDGICDLETLRQWLRDNWEGVEEKRHLFSHHIPKYGNDIDGVDDMAINVANHFCDTLSGLATYRGGTFWPGIFSVGSHIFMGALTGATPDGRFAGEIMGNGITPSNSAAVSGPTAIMNSATKLPLKRVSNGLNLNMRFDGAQINAHALVALLKGYFHNGGHQVQFIMVSRDTLLDAQKRPEDYPDLVVRISGYSATFVGLSPVAQDEIIQRTQYELK
jgi:pyruvate formate-lyase/glycerol dehydratase family glycyl radical enzyme